jgi:hypothetical protein
MAATRRSPRREQLTRHLITAPEERALVDARNDCDLPASF